MRVTDRAKAWLCSDFLSSNSSADSQYQLQAQAGHPFQPQALDGSKLSGYYTLGAKYSSLTVGWFSKHPQLLVNLLFLHLPHLGDQAGGEFTSQGHVVHHPLQPLTV